MKHIKHLHFFIFAAVFLAEFSGVQAQILKIPAPVDALDSQELFMSFNTDGTKMVILRTNDGKTGQIIEYSHPTEGSWQQQETTDALNTAIAGAEIKGLALNANADKLFIGIKMPESNNFDLFVSVKQNNQWIRPQPIGAPINTEHHEAFPSVVPNEKTLYLAKQLINPDEKIEDERQDCYIIMEANKNPRGQWEAPKALPVPVNTGCECAPFISPDQKTLYFSSKRDELETGFDVYHTKMITKNVWTTPTLLPNINSPQNEMYPSYMFFEDQLSFTKTTLQRKIFTTELLRLALEPKLKPEGIYTLEGNIFDKTTNQPIEAKILIKDPITSSEWGLVENDPKTGYYKVFLTQQNNYVLDVFAQNSSHFFHALSIGNLQNNQTEKMNFNLFRFFNLTFNVFDSELYEPLNGNIEITDTDNGEIIQAQINNLTKGRYNIRLPLGKSFDITVKSQYFEPYTLTFDATDVVQFSEFEKDVELQPQKINYQLNIKDQKTAQGIEVDVTVRNLTRNETFTTTATKGKNGQYNIKLRDGDKYEINVSPKGYSFYNTVVDLSGDLPPEEKKGKNIELAKIEKETTLTFNNITFEYNSADLAVSSYKDLDQILIFLQKNPQLKIEISAHTDDLGSDSYNLKLSNRRAQSVVNYFVDKEIPHEQLVPKGYGESQPAFPNTSEENRALNRRVELKIMEINNEK